MGTGTRESLSMAATGVVSLEIPRVLRVNLAPTDGEILVPLENLIDVFMSIRTGKPEQMRLLKWT